MITDGFQSRLFSNSAIQILDRQILEKLEIVAFAINNHCNDCARLTQWIKK